MSVPITDIAVFASGRGSNFRALCTAVRDKRLPARISALVTNVAGSGACEVAREFGVPVLEVPHADAPKGKSQRLEHEAAVMKALAAHRFDWIVLAGYMRLFSQEFIKKFWDDALKASRILNIHPSLLPAFPGKDAYAQALRHGVKLTGATVHLVGTGLDDGPIVAQRSIEICDDDTEATLVERGLKLEHELFVDTLAALFSRKWSVTSGAHADARPRVVFAPAAIKKGDRR